MADGADIYLASLKLTDPIGSYAAGARIAAQHQAIQQAEQARILDSQMKLLDSFSQQRQQQDKLALERERMAAQQQDAAERRRITEEHYQAMASRPVGGASRSQWVPPPPMGQSSQDPSVIPGYSGDPEAVRLAQMPPPIALTDAPAGTTTDDVSSYAPGSEPLNSAGPLMPGGNSMLLENGRMPYEPVADGSATPGTPLSRPSVEESANLGGGLLPASTPAASSAPAFDPNNPDIATIPFKDGAYDHRTGSTTAERYIKRPGGEVDVQPLKWDGKIGDWSPTGVPRTLSKAKPDSFTPDVPDPDKPEATPPGNIGGIVNVGNRIGYKTYLADGAAKVQEYRYNGLPPDKGGDWKPFGQARNAPPVPKTDGNGPPEVLRRDGLLWTPVQSSSGSWHYSKVMREPETLASSLDQLKASGFDASLATLSNGKPYVKGIKVDANGTAPAGSLGELTAKLPTDPKKQVQTAIETILNPKGTLDPRDKTKNLEPTADEKAAAMGKKPEQMTAQEWQAGDQIVRQKKRTAAAALIADTLNTYNAGKKGFVPRTADYWLHHMDSLMGLIENSGAAAEPAAPEATSPVPATQAPAAPSLPAPPASTPPAKASWMNKLGIR